MARTHTYLITQLASLPTRCCLLQPVVSPQCHAPSRPLLPGWGWEGNAAPLCADGGQGVRELEEAHAARVQQLTSKAEQLTLWWEQVGDKFLPAT
jgi:hypothetical protein